MLDVNSGGIDGTVQVEAIEVATYLGEADYEDTKLLCKLMAIQKALSTAFLEREVPIALTLAALISGTSIYLGGAPGTGKTSMVGAIAKHFDLKTRTQLFQIDTMPSEFIGKAEAVEYVERDADGNMSKRTKMVPDIDGGILRVGVFIADECFRGNSPALNAQLGIMNDRRYQVGKTTVNADLQLYAAMSNDLPKDRNLQAYFDRLYLRYWVEYVSENSLLELIDRADKKPIAPGANASYTPDPELILNMGNIEKLREIGGRMRLNPLVKKTLAEVVVKARAAGMLASDRKATEMVRILKCWALACGAREVHIQHLQVLNHALWETHPQRSAIVDIVTQACGNKDAEISTLVTQLTKSAKELIKRGSTSVNLSNCLVGVKKAIAQLDAAKTLCSPRVYSDKRGDLLTLQKELEAKIVKSPIV